jgi:hypothetical protein
MMDPDELSNAARNLAYALGIPVYIRDGRIYQQGPGIEVLPPKDDRTSHGFGDDFLSNSGDAAPE